MKINITHRGECSGHESVEGGTATGSALGTSHKNLNLTARSLELPRARVAVSQLQVLPQSPRSWQRGGLWLACVSVVSLGVRVPYDRLALVHHHVMVRVRASGVALITGKLREATDGALGFSQGSLVSGAHHQQEMRAASQFVYSFVVSAFFLESERYLGFRTWLKSVSEGEPVVCDVAVDLEQKEAPPAPSAASQTAAVPQSDKKLAGDALRARPVVWDTFEPIDENGYSKFDEKQKRLWRNLVTIVGNGFQMFNEGRSSWKTFNVLMDLLVMPKRSFFHFC
jgi:hypothetical protein